MVDFCRNLDSGVRISVYRQWIAKLKQLIGMIGEAHYHDVTEITLSAAVTKIMTSLHPETCKCDSCLVSVD
jgi:hypothetical protein